MKLCYVTDRKALPGTAEAQIALLLEKMDKATAAGVDWIQIREKDLDARHLLSLLRKVGRRLPSRCRIVVNDRLDVALIHGADGVHLGEHSLPVPEARRLITERAYKEGFLVGVSAHSVKAVEQAEAEGADYAIFGPVFVTPSKLQYGTPRGLQELAAACRAVSIPVLAIGGITQQNARECLKAGAAGVAAIRLFQDVVDLKEIVQKLRAK